jgi:hypothetical protein
VHLAAMEGHSECLQTLVTHGAYVNFVDFSEERYVLKMLKLRRGIASPPWSEAYQRIPGIC